MRVDRCSGAVRGAAARASGAPLAARFAGLLPPSTACIDVAEAAPVSDAAGIGPATIPATLDERAAVRHADALLFGLRTVQTLALAGGDVDGARESLLALMRGAPNTSDPGLAALLRAIRARAAASLARLS